MSASSATRRFSLFPEDYACTIPGFVGPLDLLLRLIEREELDITEISLALVADQFLDYLNAQPNRDPVVLAEFAAVASRLLVLKTRGLFPRSPEAPAAPTDAGVDDDDLVQQLLEYRRMKEAAAGFGARDRAGERAFLPQGIPIHATAGVVPEITLAPVGAPDLLRAVHRRLARQPVAPRLLRLIPRISVGEMAARILERLRLVPAATVRLSTLAQETPDRGDMVTTFMAILELVRRRRVDAEQERPFGDIVVRPASIAPVAPLADEGQTDA